MDQTEDIDDRKAIRGRMQELRAIERGWFLVFLRKKILFKFSIIFSVIFLLIISQQPNEMQNWND